MKKVLFGLAATCCLALINPKQSNAQALGHDYRTGLGIKFGSWAYDGGAALEIKHFIKPNAALEGLLSFGTHWFSFTGLYEFHGNISGAPGLKWYAGPGAHVGLWNNYKKNDGAFFGVDGVLGLDYKFNKVPISISADVQPAIDIPNGGFWVGGGLGVRFTF